MLEITGHIILFSYHLKASVHAEWILNGKIRARQNVCPSPAPLFKSTLLGKSPDPILHTLQSNPWPCSTAPSLVTLRMNSARVRFLCCFWGTDAALLATTLEFCCDLLLREHYNPLLRNLSMHKVFHSWTSPPQYILHFEELVIGKTHEAKILATAGQTMRDQTGGWKTFWTVTLKSNGKGA